MRIRGLKETFPWTKTEHRSPGLHLSDVIRDMSEALDRTTQRDWETGSIPEALKMQFEKGWLWEVVLSNAFAGKSAHRIGEVELDGIIMTPDGVIFDHIAHHSHFTNDTQPECIEEYKCTAVSCTKSPADNWQWMMQVKGYCKAVGVVKCIFRVLHHMEIMWHPEECYKVWEIVFTQRELDENWESVLNHVKVMKER